MLERDDQGRSVSVSGARSRGHLQTRHLHDTPLVFAGKMWKGLVDWAAPPMLRPGFELARPADLQIPHCVDDAGQAIAFIREYHRRWQAAQGKRA
jgi:hypothetical protein